ncbi:hypothetical protein ACQZV8_18430 [Magnetococcales bacterium HHB-1]
MEQEIKLTSPSKEHLHSLLKDPEIIRTSQGRSVMLKPYKAFYQDTALFTLLKKRFAFRISGSDTRYWAGLKGAREVVKGVACWEEIEIPIPHPVQRLEQLPSGALRTRLSSLLNLSSPLHTLFVTDIDRQALILIDDHFKAELALDYGVVVAGENKQKICEAELELIEGSFEALQSFSWRLAERENLTPATESKFSLGLSLMSPASLSPPFERHSMDMDS